MSQAHRAPNSQAGTRVQTLPCETKGSKGKEYGSNPQEWGKSRERDSFQLYLAEGFQNLKTAEVQHNTGLGSPLPTHSLPREDSMRPRATSPALAILDGSAPGSARLRPSSPSVVTSCGSAGRGRRWRPWGSPCDWRGVSGAEPGTNVGGGGRVVPCRPRGRVGQAPRPRTRLSLALAPVATDVDAPGLGRGLDALDWSWDPLCVHMDCPGVQHSSPPPVCIRRHTLYTRSLGWHGLLCVQRRVKLSECPTPSSGRLPALPVLTRSYTVSPPSLTQPGHAARSHQTPSNLGTNAMVTSTTTSLVYILGIFPDCGAPPGTEKVLYNPFAVVLERRLHN